MNFDQTAWLFWIVLGLVLIVAEIFTLGFVLFWFGIGALLAALAGLLGFGLGVQFLVFATVSVGLTIMSRTIFSSYLFHRDDKRIKTAIDTLPGMVGTVSADSKGSLNEAAVKVYGSTWTAFPMDEETKLMQGDKVEVVEVRGSSIYVRKAIRELPGWRDAKD